VQGGLPPCRLKKLKMSKPYFNLYEKICHPALFLKSLEPGGFYQEHP